MKNELWITAFFNAMPVWFNDFLAGVIILAFIILIFLLLKGIDISVGKFRFKIGKKNNRNYLLFEKLENLNKQIWNIEENEIENQQMVQAKTKLSIIIDSLSSGFLAYVNSMQDSLTYQKINYFSLFLEYFEKVQKEKIGEMIQNDKRIFSSETDERGFNDFVDDKVEEFVIIGSKIFERYYSQDMAIRSLFRNDNQFKQELRKTIWNLIIECREIQICNEGRIIKLLEEKQIIYKEFEK